MEYLQVGESINTFDPAVALRGQKGTFSVKTQGGEEWVITCKPGHSIASVQRADYHDRRPFLVTKISEPATTRTEENLATNPAA